ncbi:MAG: serine hydrolase [Acidobacteriota bacterium]
MSSSFSPRAIRVQAVLAVLALSVSIATQPLSAIVMRHDRDDAAYRELGARYPSVGHFGKTGSGVLIAPRWVLTAAHVARAVGERKLSFDVAGVTIATGRVLLHPQWHDGGAKDLGLVELDQSTEGTATIPPCGSEPAVGDLMSLAGWGDPGNGQNGPRAASPALRAASNRVQRIDADWIVFGFEAPPAGETLEGVSGPGDSGGPAISTSEPACVAGISVWGDGQGRGPGRYGSEDGYARVASERQWILDTIAELEVAQPVSDSVPNSAPGSVAEAAALRQIASLAAAAEASGEFSGVVLLERHHRIALAKGFGFAERSFAAPISPDTKFNLGSVNKLFTTVAIAQLAAAGRLKLDDTVARLLPDYPNRGVAASITVRQLLDHSSGMGDFFPGMRRLGLEKGMRTLSDYLPSFVDDPLQFPAGSEHRYSNSGFVVLGLIIERLSGESYYDYVAHHLFEPAGMQDTASYEVDEATPQRAVGYTQEGGRGLRANLYRLPARGSSAGGGYSTALDLQRFSAALRAGKLLDPTWASWILNGMPAGDPPVETRVTGARAVAGGADGINAVFEIDADDQGTLVVLANLDPPAAEALAQAIQGVLRRLR